METDAREHPLVATLRENGLLSDEKAAELGARLKEDWRSPIEVIQRFSGLTEEKLLQAVGKYLGIPVVENLAELVVPEMFFDAVPLEYAREAGVVARSIGESRLDLVVALGPDMGAVTEEMAHRFHREATCALAPRREIENAVDRAARQRPEYLASAADELGQGEFEESAAQIERVTDFAELMRKTPVVKLVSLLVAQAVRTGSSDIHFQPMGDRLRVRFRTDGILHDVLDLPRSAQDAVISRVKVLGKMDIAERRAPQDGRASFRYHDHDIDVRISVVPTDEGERAVLRLFDKEAKLLNLEELGLDARNLARFEQLIRCSHGMILVTGPTGSGKTTTLYAALRKINSPEMNIITIEDPVEYKLPGVSQIQVLPKKNVTFATMLRSVVRQDPDVIMIGEVRDSETAAIAVQSALTGHLVLTTVHTNDAAGAVVRLIDLGVEPFHLSAGLLGVLAQRLVRRICNACAVEHQLTRAEAETLEIGEERLRGARARVGKGCENCLRTGYRGRIGIFELLVVDDTLRQLINDRASATDVRKAAMLRGMTLLRQDGAEKVLSGLTTVDEVLRVTQREVS